MHVFCMAQAMLMAQCADADVIITTALIPNRPAPVLVKAETIAQARAHAPPPRAQHVLIPLSKQAPPLARATCFYPSLSLPDPPRACNRCDRGR